MSELNVIKAYYDRVVERDFPGAGEIAAGEPRIKAVSVRGCHGNTQNVLFCTLTLEDGRVRGLKYECQYCDPMMYVVAELVGELLDGRPIDEITAIDDSEITEALGGPSRKVLREARTAIRLIAEGLGEDAKH